MAGAAAVFEVAGREGQGGELLSSPGEGDAVGGGEQAHDFGQGADGRAAQHRVRPVGAADFGCDGVGVGVGQADGRVGESEPAFGLVGDQGAEAGGAGQGEGSGVEAVHHILGAAPTVDGLG